MTPLITCVVPVWNGDAFLTQALDSIFAQTWGSFEVIVIDDGSTDSSRALVVDRPEPIRLIVQRNAGPIIARNRAIAVASGMLIAFLDHDDLWLPDKLARQAAAFAAEPDLAACTGMVREFRTGATGDRIEGTEAITGNIPSAMMLSRHIIDRIGPLDASLSHGDMPDWILRARHAGFGMMALPDVVTLRRRHAGNRSQLLNAGVRRDFLRVLKADLDRRRATPATRW
jgi:glycosyltransferase involved in cell wall biosynthesis